MFTIALTGGVASGKSTVAKLFASHGIDIIDTDQIARDVVRNGTPAHKSIIDHFGKSILLDDKELDRSKLREIIFTNPDEKHFLEQLLHPLIREKMIEQVKQATSNYCICVIPLLAETSTPDCIDRVLVVDAQHQDQLDRLLSRDTISKTLAENMINTQVTRQQRLAIADDVIDNSKDLNHLRLQVDKLHNAYTTLAST